MPDGNCYEIVDPSFTPGTLADAVYANCIACTATPTPTPTPTVTPTPTPSPTDRLDRTFRKHDSKYTTIMKQTWGNKNEK